MLTESHQQSSLPGLRKEEFLFFYDVFDYGVGIDVVEG